MVIIKGMLAEVLDGSGISGDPEVKITGDYRCEYEGRLTEVSYILVLTITCLAPAVLKPTFPFKVCV